MITLFTTTKDFIGINRSNQLNAIRSWLKSSFSTQVIIFGSSIGVEEIGDYPDLLFVDQVKQTSTGAPFANEMFHIVSNIAKHPICCYINADILLTNKFFEVVLKVHKSLKKKYLLVGERLDVDVSDELSFDDNWETFFLNKHSSSFKLHAPTGSDYFVFPRGQYNKKNMPELYIGRPGWDLWMIYNARAMGYKVIDMSPTVQVIHQNHDYSHKLKLYDSVVDDPEAATNLRDIPQNAKYIYTLLACNYAYQQDGSFIRNYARGNDQQSLEIENSFSETKYFGILTFLRYSKKISIKILSHLFTTPSSKHFLQLVRAPKIKFNIGSAGVSIGKDWFSTDIDTLNVTKKSDWSKLLFFLKADNIFAEHVWEHLSASDTVLANHNCYKFLKSGSTLRLAVPDGFNPDKTYIEWVRPGGNGPGADDHKILYNYKSMKAALESIGFKVQLLEYWDELGNFHFVDWSDEAGRVSRSRRFDSRNIDGKLNYTSLIIDAIKP